MGLFSNKNNPCPVCGGATPRLLAKKIEGQPICGKCADSILADDDKVKNFTLEELREHLRMRENNKKTVDSFTPTRTVEYEHEAVIDDAKRIFYIKRWTVDNPPVFSFDEIQGFTIELGYHVVESWSRGMARVPFQPAQTGVLGGIAALAEAFDSDREKESEYENLRVMLKVNTRYLSEYELCDLSVSGEGQASFANDLALEMGNVNAICNLIISLAAVSAPASAAAPNQTVADPDHTVDDIMKYKNLMEAGVITQEEFNAKKKQLLGI